jgi:hypothetical protein
MKLEIIGRDPVLTMKITRMLGERAAKEQKRKDMIASLLMPFTMTSKWIGGLR